MRIEVVAECFNMYVNNQPAQKQKFQCKNNWHGFSKHVAKQKFECLLIIRLCKPQMGIFAFLTHYSWQIEIGRIWLFILGLIQQDGWKWSLFSRPWSVKELMPCALPSQHTFWACICTWPMGILPYQVTKPRLSPCFVYTLHGYLLAEWIIFSESFSIHLGFL